MRVTPAALGESPSGQAVGVPYSPLYDDVYHAVAGAWAQARHVFLTGNGLPHRWQGRKRFVILETGFGLGNNFLATWAAWQRDESRCDHLVFISIEKHPLRKEDMGRVHGLATVKAGDASHIAPAPSDQREQQDQHDRLRLARRLIDAWPTPTPGLHTLHFEEVGHATHGAGALRVTLMLGLGDIADLLPKLSAQVDAFYLDGFAPAKNPQMWDEALLSRLNRLAAPGCTAATWSSARGVRDALSQAGFRVERVPGFAGKRDMVRAMYEPRFVPPALPGGIWPEPGSQKDRHAIVLGAGLAGCAAARALCLEGWRVTLIDQQDGPAQEGSGNPGGMFHSVLHAEDGIHSRAHRAAALATWRLAAPLITARRLAGQAGGLLRLDAKTSADQAHDWLLHQSLPADHVQWLDQAEAQLRSGLPVDSGGWYSHQAGWLHPAGLARLMLDEAAAARGDDGTPLLQCLWRTPIDGILRNEKGEWEARYRDKLIATAPSLVLCCANQSPTLLASLPEDQAVAPLPLSQVRGQITRVPQTGRAHLRLPHIPVAGSGYVLTLPDGALLCGATTQHHDVDPAVRDADHRHNLNQAARLGAVASLTDHDALPPQIEGRTAWRATTPDRLPLVGALPWSLARLSANPGTRRIDQVRLLPRERQERGGLYVLTGLGSRGITWCALAADLLAHWMTGAPCPVELDLRDAMDPARFPVRHLTREAERSKVAARS